MARPPLSILPLSSSSSTIFSSKLRFDVEKTQIFFGGLCPAPRWGWRPDSRSRPKRLFQHILGHLDRGWSLRQSAVARAAARAVARPRAAAKGVGEGVGEGASGSWARSWASKPNSSHVLNTKMCPLRYLQMPQYSKKGVPASALEPYLKHWLPGPGASAAAFPDGAYASPRFACPQGGCPFCHAQRGGCASCSRRKAVALQVWSPQ